MIRRSFVRRRSPAFAATESIVVLPILLLLIIGTVVGGYGVFRYQQIAMLAREGARYASVHGGQYQQETGNTAATRSGRLQQRHRPLRHQSRSDAVELFGHLEQQQHALHLGSEYEKPTGNTVTVTVNYNWVPEMYLVGPITLSSTSTVPMSY